MLELWLIISGVQKLFTFTNFKAYYCWKNAENLTI